MRGLRPCDPRGRGHVHAGLAATGGRCCWTNLLDKPAGQLRCPQVLPTGIAHSRPACAHMPHRLPASRQFEKFSFPQWKQQLGGSRREAGGGTRSDPPGGSSSGRKAADRGDAIPRELGDGCPPWGAIYGAYCVQREKGRPESRASARPFGQFCVVFGQFCSVFGQKKPFFCPNT